MPATLKRYQQLHEEWQKYYANVPFSHDAMSFEIWLINKFDAEPRGVLLSVTAEDLNLGNHIAESDLEFVTQDMLDEIADSMWHADNHGWYSKYHRELSATIADNWQYWHDMIDAEKKRQQSLKLSD